MTTQFDSLIVDFAELKARVIDLEVKVYELPRGVQRGHAAPTLIEHLKHIYDSLPLPNPDTVTTPQEAQRMFMRIREAKRELHGVLLSIGVDHGEL